MRVQISPRAPEKIYGDEREMESGLIFNQLVASSNLVVPAKILMLAVAQIGRSAAL
jgi:hypothetical protein